MKRTLIVILVLAMAAMGAAAEMLNPEAVAMEKAELPGGIRLTLGEPVSADVDSDGMEEQILCTMEPEEEYGQLRVTLTASDGEVCAYDTGVVFGGEGWIADINGDGQMEIFTWGDVMSSDYYTTCLHYVDHHLRPTLFADVERGENGSGYFKAGYGFLMGADAKAGTVMLCGSQDMAGTWFGSRVLKLSGDGLFEIADDGWWVRQDLAGGDEDWGEYRCKTLLTDVHCRIDGKEDMLKAGEKVNITGTDKHLQAGFVTGDGRTGILPIDRNFDAGWGWKIDGIPEEEVFDFLGYAD